MRDSCTGIVLPKADLYIEITTCDLIAYLDGELTLDDEVIAEDSTIYPMFDFNGKEVTALFTEDWIFEQFDVRRDPPMDMKDLPYELNEMICHNLTFNELCRLGVIYPDLIGRYLLSNVDAFHRFDFHSDCLEFESLNDFGKNIISCHFLI